MSGNLNLRQAIFVYDAARLAAIAAEAPVIPVPWAEREQEFKDQFVEVIAVQCGPDRIQSPMHLHENWMWAYEKLGWVYGEIYDRERKVHPDMVAFEDLSQLERDKDAVFVELCEIARLWIYEISE
jgi:hypothetical protein